MGELFLDLELEPDAPFASDHCGTCRRCIDACPTGAIVEERVLDSNQCISYLTIEIKGEIPAEWHAAVGELVYGCDVCQEVCPFNHKFAKPLCEPAFAPRPVLRNAEAGTLARTLLSMSPDEFAAVFKGSPMKRAKLRGLKRNSAVVLANQATDGPALGG